MAESNCTVAPLKTCVSCAAQLPATREFFNSGGRDRLRSMCKGCASADWKFRHQQKNKDRKPKHIGERFGRLTVVEKLGVGSRDNPVKYRLACDCGGEIIKAIAYVRNGSTQSCGCLRRELISARTAVDMTGERVGRLLVLHRSGVSGFGNVMWRCLCDCGAEKDVSGNSLRKARPTKSCGCLQRQLAAERASSRKMVDPVSRTKEYRASLRKRLREDPTVAMAERMSRMISLSLERVGSVKSGRTFAMLGYTPEDLRRHIELQFSKGMSWLNRAEWQIDHIIPISTARSADDVIALNQLANLRPLWAEQNNQKRAQRVLLL